MELYSYDNSYKLSGRGCPFFVQGVCCEAAVDHQR